MARTATGQEVLSQCKALLNHSKTASELRCALSVVLPLAFNLSLKQTAEIIGRSMTCTSNMRNNFIKKQLRGADETPKPPKRNRAKATLAREAEILDEVLSEAASGGIVIVPPLKPRVEALLGKSISLATLYNMLARHGWRKVAPDKIHPKGDPQAQSVWKKNCPKRSKR